MERSDKPGGRPGLLRVAAGIARGMPGLLCVARREPCPQPFPTGVSVWGGLADREGKRSMPPCMARGRTRPVPRSGTPGHARRHAVGGGVSSACHGIEPIDREAGVQAEPSGRRPLGGPAIEGRRRREHRDR